MNRTIVNPYFALIVGVIAVSASAIFVKFSDAPSGVIAFYRLLFSVLFMLPVFLMKYVKELALISGRDWLYAILAGVFLSFHFILWFESLNYTSVASSTVLVTLQPLFAFVGTFLFFKERFTLKAILCAVAAIVGSVIISWGDFQVSGTALFGDILALLACALVTAYLMFGQSVRKRISLVTYTFVVYSISSIVLLLYVLIVGESLYPYPKNEWWNFILLALIPTLLGHSLFNWAIKWISTSVISMAILFEPIGATILAYYLLSEKVLFTQVLGGSVVIVGISLFLLNERSGKQKKIKKDTLKEIVE
ncbi:DMT family transporter [Robertmurraya sp. GLU-23]